MRVSVTALDVWQECPRRWALQSEWRPLAMAGGPLLQGRAFHAAIEEALMLGSRAPEDRRERALEIASRVLAEVGSEQLIKWRPGVESALRALPDWVWEVVHPVAEDKLEVRYETLPQPFGGGVPLGEGAAHHGREVVMVGKPDLWYVKDGAVQVVELKSTGKSGAAAEDRLASYRWWGLQPQMYAVMLYDAYEWVRKLPIYVFHLLASTRGKAYDYGEDPHFMSEEKLEWVRWHMLSVAGQLGTHDTPAFGPRCEWCDFKGVCLGLLTGADTDGILEGQFARRVA